MGQDTTLLLGTGKGCFLLSGAGAGDGSAWKIRGPLADVAPINHVISDPVTGHLHGGCGGWFDHGVWRSTDGGARWDLHNTGLKMPEAEAPGVWSLARSNGRIYAGTKPAGLFFSDDDGLTWEAVEALNTHPTRDQWNPGGAGLTLHHIVTHPEDPKKLWIGISAAGVFATEDGGETWEPRNQGTRVAFGGEPPTYPALGQCVHSIARARGPGDVLYQQNHCGMYRSADGGRQWEAIETGLPSSFGFPIAVHPKDPDCAWLFPLNGDVAGRFAPDAKPAVWRTRNAGASWEALRDGLPQDHAYFTVLRQAMAVEPEEGAGLYFGTNAGEVWASDTEGERWACVARHLPPILSVEVQARLI